MAPAKFLKIVLKRCDSERESNTKRKQKRAPKARDSGRESNTDPKQKRAPKARDSGGKSNTKPKQKRAPKIQGENSSIFPAATIKVENEFIKEEVASSYTAKGDSKTFIDAVESTSHHFGGNVRSSVSGSHVSAPFFSNVTSFDFSPTDIVVKTEREEGNNLLADELVSCSVEDNVFKADGREVMVWENFGDSAESVSFCSNSPTDLDQFNFPQTTLCIKAEETVEEALVKNELVYSTFADGALTAVDNDEEILGGNLNNLPGEWKNSIKTESVKAEEGHIISELVGRVPNDLEDCEGGSVIMFPKKVLEIRLERCDAASKSNSKPKQNQASKKRKDSPSSSAAPIKVENKVVGNGIVLMRKAAESEGNAMCAVNTSQLDFRLPAIRDKNSSNIGTNLTKAMLARVYRNRWKLRFECSHCGTQYKSKMGLADHIHRVHCGKVDTCKYCSARLKRQLTGSEVYTYSGKELLSCPHCPKMYIHIWGLEAHLRCSAGEVQCPSEHCSAKFSHRCGLRAHQRSAHPGEKRFACNQCPARFTEEGTLKVHLLTHTNERNHACSQCPAKFKTRETLMGHIKTHAEGRRYDCAICSCHYKTKNSLRYHLKVVHFGAEKSFACEQCPARFYRKDTLKEHLLLHGTEKFFTCDKCPAKFITASKLKRHSSVHSNERPYKCKTCPKLFKSHRTMQRHAKIHSGVNLHACDQCPAKFVAPFLLKIHKEGHSSNPVTCKLCSKKYKSEISLQHHLKSVHSPERPYSCPQCSLRFLSLKKLNNHSTLHTDERRFGCAHCPARFMIRDDLLRHFAVHLERKPFACAHCSAEFSQRGALIIHLRRRHKDSGVALLPK